jgi:hypothetical protein
MIKFCAPVSSAALSTPIASGSLGVLEALRSPGGGRFPEEDAFASDKELRHRGVSLDEGRAPRMSLGPLGAVDVVPTQSTRRKQRAAALLRALDGARLYHALRAAQRLVASQRGEEGTARPGDVLRNVPPHDLTTLLAELRPFALGALERRELGALLARDAQVADILARSLVVSGFTFPKDPLLAKLQGNLPVIDWAVAVENAMRNKRVRSLLLPFRLDGAVRRSEMPFWLVDSVRGEFLYHLRSRVYESAAEIEGTPLRAGISADRGELSVVVQTDDDLPKARLPKLAVNGLPITFERVGEGRLKATAFVSSDTNAVHLFEGGRRELTLLLAAVLYRGYLTTRR